MSNQIQCPFNCPAPATDRRSFQYGSQQINVIMCRKHALRHRKHTATLDRWLSLNRFHPNVTIAPRSFSTP